MRTLYFCILAFFVLSCTPQSKVSNIELRGVRYFSGGFSKEIFKVKKVKDIKLQNPDCKEEEALKDLGDVQISLINSDDLMVTYTPIKGTKNEVLVESDYGYSTGRYSLKRVKGNPISSSYINSVIINEHVKITKKGCKSWEGDKIRVECDSYDTEIINPGEAARLCKYKGAYERNSLENHILAAVTSVQKTVQCFKDFFPKNMVLPKVDINLFPKEETVFHMKKNAKGKIPPPIKTVKSDNAYHLTGLGIASLPRIGFLPQSEQGKKNFYSPLTLNLGIGSHETGHYIYMLHTGAALSLVNYQAGLRNHQNYRMISDEEENGKVRLINSMLVYNAINEGIADAVATLCFYNNKNSTLKFSHAEHIIRDSDQDKVNVEVVEKKGVTLSNKLIAVNKSLDKDRLRHFFSEKKKKVINPQIMLNDKDKHHIGAIAVFSLFKYWEVLDNPVKFLGVEEDKGKGAIKKAKKLLMEAIENIGQVIPNNEPSVYLDDLLFAMIKGPMKKNKEGKHYVKERVCDLLKERFPVNFIGFQNNFLCVPNKKIP